MKNGTIISAYQISQELEDGTYAPIGDGRIPCMIVLSVENDNEFNVFKIKQSKKHGEKIVFYKKMHPSYIQNYVKCIGAEITDEIASEERIAQCKALLKIPG